MADKQRKKGVHVHRGKIRIDFYYEGKRCRESLGIAPTDNNMKYAEKHRAGIIEKIRLETFNYADYFPKSPRATFTEKTALTFEQAAQKWLGLQSHIAKSTYRSYNAALQCFWIPAIGSKPINQVMYSDILAAISSKKWGNNKTRNNYIIPLRQIFEMCLADGVIDKNPAQLIKNASVQKPEPDPLTKGETEALLAWMREHYHPQVVNYFEFAFLTGLRTSELIALEWGDVDLLHKRIRVSKAKVEGEIKETKTYKVRLVDLSDRACELLRRQKSLTYVEGREVFRNPDTGLSWASDQMQRRKYWHPALRALGLRSRHAYQTRHTYATTLLMGGVNPAYIASQLGHNNMKMLLERYGKWIPYGDGGSEASKVNALFSLRLVPSLVPEEELLVA